MFWKFENNEWVSAIRVEFPDGTIIDENNKISYDGWIWLDESPIADDTLLSDITFGQSLIKTFLQDNRKIQGITESQSIQLLQKFQVIRSFCEVGDIKSVNSLLPTLEIDSVFTQERKDKYILLVQNYLNS